MESYIFHMVCLVTSSWRSTGEALFPGPFVTTFSMHNDQHQM